jgi:hypothetical protein
MRLVPVMGANRIYADTLGGRRNRIGSIYEPSSFTPKCKLGRGSPGWPLPVLATGSPALTRSPLLTSRADNQE